MKNRYNVVVVDAAIVRTRYSNPLTCKMATIGRDVLAPEDLTGT